MLVIEDPETIGKSTIVTEIRVIDKVTIINIKYLFPSKGSKYKLIQYIKNLVQLSK